MTGVFFAERTHRTCSPRSRVSPRTRAHASSGACTHCRVLSLLSLLSLVLVALAPSRASASPASASSAPASSGPRTGYRTSFVFRDAPRLETIRFEAPENDVPVCVVVPASEHRIDPATALGVDECEGIDVVSTSMRSRIERSSGTAAMLAQVILRYDLAAHDRDLGPIVVAVAAWRPGMKDASHEAVASFIAGLAPPFRADEEAASIRVSSPPVEARVADVLGAKSTLLVTTKEGPKRVEVRAMFGAEQSHVLTFATSVDASHRRLPVLDHVLSTIRYEPGDLGDFNRGPGRRVAVFAGISVAVLAAIFWWRRRAMREEQKRDGGGSEPREDQVAPRRGGAKRRRRARPRLATEPAQWKERSVPALALAITVAIALFAGAVVLVVAGVLPPFVVTIVLVGGGLLVGRRMPPKRFVVAIDDDPTPAPRGPQISGRPCAECEERIVHLLDGLACDACHAPVHHRCHERHRAVAHRVGPAIPYRS